MISNCLLVSAVPSGETSKRFGLKKVLATIRKNHETWRRWEKQTTGKSTRKLKNKLAKSLSSWMLENLEPVWWEHFFEQVFNEGCRCDDLRKFAPRLFEELRFDSDWQKVIESTKPPRKGFRSSRGLLGLSDAMVRHLVPTLHAVCGNRRGRL